MKASSFVFCLAALAGITAACTTETRIVHEAPDPTLPSPTGDPSGEEPPLAEAGAGTPDSGPTTGQDSGNPQDSAPPPLPPPPPPALASDVGRVSCSANGGASLYCPTGDVCCVQNAVKNLAPIVLSCETFNGCKSRPDPLPVVCDGPEDCKPGEYCWGITTTQLAFTSLCSTTSLGAEWKRLCNPGTADECAVGETCVPTTAAPAVGVCR